MKHLYLKLLLVTGVLLLGQQQISAQLAAGDLAIIGYNTDAFGGGRDHEFTFITLIDVPAGEVIFFTEEGWNSNTNAWMGTTEGHYSWTAPAGGAPCGTVIHIYETTTPDVLALNGVGTLSGLLSGASWNLSAGDQVLMYQGASAEIAAPTFITGVHGDYNGACYDAGTTWNGTTCPGTASSNVPTGLTNGTDCISLFPSPGPEQDNAMYTGSLTGTAAAIRALIMNPANWTFNNITAFDITPASYSPSITCAAPCTDPDVPTITATPATICPGASSTLTWAGANLNDATAWHVYTTSCGTGLLTTTASTSLVVTPGSTTTYYIRGEDGAGCVDESTGVCGAVTVTVQDIVNPTITCPGNQTGSVDASCNFTLPDYTGLATASDNCTASPTVTQLPLPGTIVGVGTTNVVLTATDGSSNTANCNFNVVVSDVTNPTITCPGNQTGNVDASCLFTLPDYTGLATPADNCPGVTVTQSPAPGTNVGVGTTIITLTATDASSNTANCNFNVVVSDVTNPTAVCQNITVFLDGAGNASITAADLDAGSTDNCAGLTLSASQTAFTCADLGANNVTLTATDGSSNTANCIAVVTVSDTTSPTITCPGNQTETPDASCNFTLPDYTGLATPADNCGSTTVTQSPIPGTVISANTTITLTANDGSANTSTCQFDVILNDITAPTAVCQNISVFLDGAGNATITAADIDGGSTDNCAGLTLSASQTAFTCADIGPNNVTLTATDGNSNTANCVAVVTVSDTTSPTAVCQNISAFLDATGNVTIAAADIDAGSTDNCGTVTLNASQTAFTCTDIGANNVTLTVTDGSANTSNCVAVVTILDTVSPTAVCQNINAYVDGAGNATIAAADIDAGSTDNCGTVTLSASQTAFTCADVGPNNVTLTVTDGSSNTSNCIAVVTVLDTISPTAVCQNINAFLDGTGNATITAADLDGGSTDNCGAVTLSASQTAFSCSDLVSAANDLVITGVIDGPLTGGTPKAIELYVVRNIADLSQYGFGSANNGGGTDGQEFTFPAVAATAGSYIYVASESAEFTNFFGFAPDYVAASTLLINGDDAIELFFAGGVIDVFGDINVDGTGQPWEYLDGWAYRNNGTGNDGSTFTIGNWTFSGINVLDGEVNNATAATPFPTGSYSAIGGSGTINVTLTATDGSSNTDNCVAVVTLADTTAPTITCPGNQTETPDASCNFTLTDYTGLAVASDNCASVTVTQSPTAGTVISGNTTITLTVTDGAGNSAICTFDVILNDVTAPTAVCQNINTFLDGAGNATIVASDLDGGSTDNCSGLTFSASQTAFTCADLGANNVTLTVTDGNSNTDNCIAVVTVLDTVAPTAVCQNINVYVDGAGNATFVAADIDGGSTDNCGAITLSASQTAFTCADIGANNVTLTVTDGSSNTANCVAVVTVLDTVPPVATCQNINVYLDGAGNASIVAADINAGTLDNCGVVTLAASQTAFTCADVGSNNVTLTATDGSLNTDNCIAVVTVMDTISPTSVCQNINAYVDGAGNATIVAADLDGGSTDNCTTVSFGASQTAFTCADLGANNVTLTVTDGSSNTDNCLAVVTVLDTVSPAITCPGNQVENFDASCQFTLPDYTSLVTATDNCGGTPTVTQSPVAGTVVSGNSTITMTADDGNGNTAVCTFDVIPNDATPPVITVCPPNQTGTAGAGCMYVLPDYTGLATATDNCGTPTITQSPIPGSSVGVGINTITITADDGVNTTTCTFDVDVSGATAAFSSTPSAGCAPLDVAFTESSTNAVSWEWDFGDGSPADTNPNPSHTYTDTGSYDVTLIVGNGNGCFDTLVSVNEITVYPPIAAFTASPTVGCGIPHTVFFTDQSTLPDTWFWDFGDLNTSTLQNPVHNYTAFGSYTVYLTVTDTVFGCSDTDSIVIDVQDIQPPTVTCPGNQTEIGDASCQGILADYTGLASATDLCDPAPVLTQNPSAGTTFIGTLQVWIIATDAAGNSDSCSFDVSILDTVSPTITCPADQDVSFDATCAYTLVDYTSMATTSDNCGAVTVTQSPIIGAVITDTTTVTLYADDGNGNIDSCAFNVNPSDNTAPSITCPSDQNEVFDASCQFTLPDYTGLVTASDNCGTPTVTQSPASGTVITGTTTITMTAIDGNGNADSCTFDVIPVDTAAPVAVCQDITVYLDGVGNVDIVGSDVDAGSTDACGIATLSVSPSSFTCAEVGVNVVTLTVTDGAGNTATCTANVTVLDSIVPTITCPADQNVSLDANCEFVMPDYTTMATTTDNCTVAVTQSPAVGTVITSATTVTLTADDGSGNFTTCTFNINPSDTDPPVVSCPPDETIILDGNCEVTLPDYIAMASVTDNCDASPTITQSPAAGTLYSAETAVTVSIIAQDATGNIDSCSLVVTVGTDASSGCNTSVVVNDLLSPNGDGKNDFWIIHEPAYIVGCDVLVYNRWGQKVFESHNYDNTWDGTYNGDPLPDGSYYYVIQCNGEVTHKGALTILRLKK